MNEREIRRNKFLAGELKNNEAIKFLGEEQIKYVYWGYQEQAYGEKITAYNFLKPVFQNPQVTIFQVKF